MSDHIPDATKMIQDTPRTNEQINGKPCTRFEMLAGDCLRNAAVPSEFARQLELELNAANDRINRLEEAGDDRAMFVRNLQRHLNAANERIQRLEDIIKRASNEFFRDGSDIQVANKMLTILEEVRLK